jgi:hypothetical protein
MPHANAVTALRNVARVQVKSDLVNARAGGYLEAREVKPHRCWRCWRMTLAESSSSHTIFA